MSRTASRETAAVQVPLRRWIQAEGLTKDRPKETRDPRTHCGSSPKARDTEQQDGHPVWDTSSVLGFKSTKRSPVKRLKEILTRLKTVFSLRYSQSITISPNFPKGPSHLVPH